MEKVPILLYCARIYTIFLYRVFEGYTKRPFTAKGLRAEQLLELVHSDVCGPFSTQARGGYEYYFTFIDDYSRYRCVYLMNRKFETFDKFKEFHAED